MNGLRDRQRQKRRKRIVFSAARLFASNGYDSTTMEDIARDAEISTPTIYNYFRSKSEILLDLLEYDKELMDEKIELLIDHPPTDPVEAIFELVRTDILFGYDISNKKIWLLISAASLEASAESRERFLNLQNVFTGKIERLVNVLQADGRLRADVNAGALARIVNAITRDAFRRYLLSDEASMENLLDSVRQQLDLVCRGLS